MLIFISVIILFFVSMVLILYSRSKPTKRIVDKYGLPIAHFTTPKCWKSLPIKGATIDMDFYEDFISISGDCSDLCLHKDFKDYEIMGSYLVSVLEININDKKLQIELTHKQKKLLQDFFEGNE